MDSYFDEDALLGESIGDWRLESLLGEGGMSFIFRGVHVSSGLEGAVKLLRPEFCQNQQTVLRFEQEARLAGQLQHENIVRVLDFGRDAKRSWYFMVLELLDGLDLATLMRLAPFPKRWIAALTQQICSALEVAHNEGIIHRDLKPSNIFLLPRQPFPLVKLLDFGVAKLIYQQTGHQITQAGEIIGTPAYVAPEQFSPKEPLSHSADIYALGVLLFQLFTGRLPIDGGSAIAHAVMVLQQDAPLLGKYRQEFAGTPLESFLQRMLSKRPSERPASMKECWQLFSALAQALLDPIDTVDRLPNLKALMREHRPGDVVADGPASGPVSGVAVEPVEHGEQTFVMPEGAGDLDAGEVTFVAPSSGAEWQSGASQDPLREHLRSALEGLALDSTAIDRERDPQAFLASSRPLTGGQGFSARATSARHLRAADGPESPPALKTEVELESPDLGEMTMMDEEFPIVLGTPVAGSQPDSQKGIEEDSISSLFDEALGKETVRDTGDLVAQVRARSKLLPLSPEQPLPWQKANPEGPSGPSSTQAELGHLPVELSAGPATWVTESAELVSVQPTTKSLGIMPAAAPVRAPRRFVISPMVWGLCLVFALGGLVVCLAWLVAQYLV